MSIRYIYLVVLQTSLIQEIQSELIITHFPPSQISCCLCSLYCWMISLVPGCTDQKLGNISGFSSKYVVTIQESFSFSCSIFINQIPLILFTLSFWNPLVNFKFHLFYYWIFTYFIPHNWSFLSPAFVPHYPFTVYLFLNF